jgi:hypothetical protein
MGCVASTARATPSRFERSGRAPRQLVRESDENLSGW